MSARTAIAACTLAVPLATVALSPAASAEPAMPLGPQYSAATCGAGVYSEGYIIASCTSGGHVMYDMVCDPVVGYNVTYTSEVKILSKYGASVKLKIKKCPPLARIASITQFKGKWGA